MDKAMKDRLSSMEKAVSKREASKVYQFPLWAEPQRGLPNDFARSALFSARKGAGNEFLRDQQIFAQSGISITYTGARLTQDHLDVFEGIMHLARAMPEGSAVRFTERGLLKLIGRATGGKDHKRLLLTLTDLTATSITIKRGDGRVYWGSLLPEGAAIPEENGKYVVILNRQLIKLFERGFTLVEIEQRRALARSPLAKHLQCWLSSHEKPYPVTVQYLHDVTDSGTRHLWKFRQSLKAALDRLVEVGVLQNWRIDDADKVHLVKA